MKTRAFLTCLLLSAGLILTASDALAQAQGGGRGRGGMGVLTQEQRTTMRDALQGELGPVMQRLTAAQKEVAAAALNNASEETIKAKMEAVNKIQTELTLLRYKAVKKIAPTLTADQKSQLAEARDGGYSALFGGFGGFGGAGRGGGAAGGGRRGNNN